MRTVLVTGSDTGVGKTRVVAALARLCAADGSRVQVVKVVETGTNADPAFEGDARRAHREARTAPEIFTLASFAAPLAPASAARAEGGRLSFDDLISRARALPPCDWRLLEGAGGIATPLDESGRDWADFAEALKADAVVIVVPDRLGAINQARLAHGRAANLSLSAGIWLNATAPVDLAVAASTRDGLRSTGIPLWAEQAHGAELPREHDNVLRNLSRGFALQGSGSGDSSMRGNLLERTRAALAARDRQGLRRTLKVTEEREDVLNLADNDYLALARDPVVVAALAGAAAIHGTSASASPLITGWRQPHAALLEELCAWHGFPFGLLWTSGYAANSAILGQLPARGDLVLADRLIHNSMIAGLLRSGARMKRYGHLALDELEELLVPARASGHEVFVVTESVFSMDGDSPDMKRLAELKRRHGFIWVLDEAHALGWYGPGGAGLARAAGVEAGVDILVGTLGKTLASGGAYSLFRDEALRDHLANTAGEFVYSTALPPANAAAAAAALGRVKALAGGQGAWHQASRDFRARLSAEGWAACEGESPVVPVRLDDPMAAVGLAEALRKAGILVGAVRPPTVPAGTSRLRISLKRTFGPDDAGRVIAAMAAWRAQS